MSSNFVIMNINPNQGYSPDQVDSRLTLGELLNEIEGAISEFGEDAIVVTRDNNNRYGASFGRLPVYELFDYPEDSDGE